MTTTYPKAKLAAIKKRGGFFIAHDLLTEIKWQGGTFIKHTSAGLAAWIQIDNMTTRQLYQFLKDNGYSFNPARAIWQAAEVEASS